MIRSPTVGFYAPKLPPGYEARPSGVFRINCDHLGIFTCAEVSMSKCQTRVLLCEQGLERHFYIAAALIIQQKRILGAHAIDRVTFRLIN